MNAVWFKVLEGRDFVVTDSVNLKKLNVIITQSLAKLMGKGSALGKTLRWEGDTSGTVVNSCWCGK